MNLHPAIATLYCVLLILGLSGCPARSRPLPQQQVPPSPTPAPSALPAHLQYPGATQRFPGNNLIYLSPDPLATIADWYATALPDAERENRSANAVHLENDDWQIKLEFDGESTQITLIPILPTPPPAN